MDFVEGLGDTSGIPEFAADAIGRLEVRNGRVRVTLVAYRDGGIAFPVVSMVWSAEAWSAAQADVEKMRKVVSGKMPDPHEGPPATAVAMTH